ncbi:hypothetical protein Pint_04908 [Pistacia integerrima]|uniref:Uncharacterized protein n=1 Tax=Pistacia integerrima TaxID=434235 RepID=A0ACC0Z4A7_9ROSI|nr:hypothetical protein Pint_04908 [Pistacia integerrima]
MKMAVQKITLLQINLILPLVVSVLIYAENLQYFGSSSYLTVEVSLCNIYSIASARGGIYFIYRYKVSMFIYRIILHV